MALAGMIPTDRHLLRGVRVAILVPPLLAALVQLVALLVLRAERLLSGTLEDFDIVSCQSESRSECVRWS